MKTLRKIILAVMLIAVPAILSAEDCGKKDKNDDWKVRIEAERIAYLSTRMALTPEEAQVFWPVYNEMKKEGESTQCSYFNSFKQLKKAISEEGNDAEVAKALDAYLKASEAKCAFKTKQAEKFEKVLPATKVAIFFLAEEDFRKVQFEKFKHHNHSDLHKGCPDKKPHERN